MNIIERTKQLFSAEAEFAIINPAWLSAMPVREENKLLNQRTAFLTFHRFIYKLSDIDICKLLLAHKQVFEYVSRNSQDCDGEFCHLSLIHDALMFQAAIREGDAVIAGSVAISFHKNVEQANASFITSDYLILILKTWLPELSDYHQLSPH